METLRNRVLESVVMSERVHSGVVTMSDETNRRNMFEIGTPATYFNGTEDIDGEVVRSKSGHQAIMSYGGNRNSMFNTPTVPKSWFMVRKFNSRQKEYIEKYGDDETRNLAIDKLINGNTAFFDKGGAIIYWK